MSLKINLEKGLDRIAQNSSDDMFLTIYLEPLFKVGFNLDESALQDISTIDDPLIRAVHRYLSWELSEKDDFTIITDLFAFLRESIIEYSEKGAWNVVSLCFQQLISKGIQFGQDEILKLDIEKFKNLLDEINELPFRNQYTILETYINVLKYIKNKINYYNNDLNEKIYVIVDGLSEKYKNEGMFRIERPCLELKLDISNLMLKEESNEIKKRIAESNEAEGDIKANGTGLIFFANAYMGYLKNNNKEDLERIKTKLVKSSIKIQKTMKTFSYSFQIKDSEIDKLVIEFLSELDDTQPLKSYVFLDKNYPEIIQQDAVPMPVFAGLFPEVHLDDVGNVLAIMEEDDEKRKKRAIDLSIMNEAVLKNIRKLVFDQMLSKNIISEEDIYELIQSSNIKKLTKERLEHGINCFFKEDYISACHILALQIEDVLRSLVKENTNIMPIMPKRNRTGATQEITLGYLLENEEVKALFKDDFYNYLEIYLIYDLGLNIRNEIAHGLVNTNVLDKEMTLALLLIIFRLLYKLMQE